MLIYLDTEVSRFFSDPEIARLPRSQQVAALATYFGVAVTFDAAHGWREWYPDEVRQLWGALRKNQIVGWNVVHFDIPLIQEAARLAGAHDPATDLWTDFDLFAAIRARTGRWYKLEEIAQANLGRGKSGDGQQAAEWLASGDSDLARRAAAYCRLDVELVIDLHRLAQTSGLLLPPRANDVQTQDVASLTTYRWWCSAAGYAWRLAIDGGEEIASAGWPE